MKFYERAAYETNWRALGEVANLDKALARAAKMCECKKSDFEAPIFRPGGEIIFRGGDQFFRLMP